MLVVIILVRVTILKKVKKYHKQSNKYLLKMDVNLCAKLSRTLLKCIEDSDIDSYN